MGDPNIQIATNEQQVRLFTKALLNELLALEEMLVQERFEQGVKRAGIEQEMFLIEQNGRPASIACQVLEQIEDSRFTTELAQYNLEVNLTPTLVKKGFLRYFEKEIYKALRLVTQKAKPLGASVLLTGILPSLHSSDLRLDNLTPTYRYQALNESLMRPRQGSYPIYIRGTDILEYQASSIMIESANTSLQLHLQVDPKEFAAFYNIAQLITAPLLAAAVNSPVLLGRRLWHETRVAVFEFSADSRSSAKVSRGHASRVNFGEAWIKNSVVEILQENIARYPILFVRDFEDDPLAKVKQGLTPSLDALMLHNGTVWRWNRPCYGVSKEGVAHLRIENRVLPSGPTVCDEIANVALFYGLMLGGVAEYGDISQKLDFVHAKNNFIAAARSGLEANFIWFENQNISARDLLLDELIPIAKKGLQSVHTSEKDIEYYLGIIEERVRTGCTGSAWMLGALRHWDVSTSYQKFIWRQLTTSLLHYQQSKKPVHQWPRDLQEPIVPKQTKPKTLRDIMSTDLFTVRPEDAFDLASALMNWRHIRFIPVESEEDQLVGIVSLRSFLELLNQDSLKKTEEIIPVSQVMISDPITAPPDTPLLEGMEKILSSKFDCLLVTEEGRLVGIVTERDFLRALKLLLKS